MVRNTVMLVGVLLASITLAGCSSEVSTGIQPAFETPTFQAVDDQGEIVAEGEQLPAGYALVQAQQPVENIGIDEQIQVGWFVEGDPFHQFRTTVRDLAGGDSAEGDTFSGEITLSIDLPGGMPPADYTFLIRHAGETVTHTNFTLGDGQGLGPLFFAEAFQGGEFVNLGTSFPNGTTQVQGFIRAIEVPANATVIETWYLDGQVAYEDNSTVAEAGATGGMGLLRFGISSQSALPDGDYRLEIRLDGELAREGTFTIG